MTVPGLFIVFEGVDGGGKSTQIKMLSQYFTEKGMEVEIHAEPTTGDIGNLIREYMNSRNRSLSPETEALLFAADRVEHGKRIRKALAKGIVVISDRYKHSSYAYQGAAGVDKEWMETLNKYALEPDLILLLDIDPDKSLERVTDREPTVFEGNTYLKKVRSGYLRHVEVGELVIIDATKPIEKVHHDVVQEVLKYMPKDEV